MTSKRWLKLIVASTVGMMVACGGGPDSEDFGHQQETDTSQATSPSVDQTASTATLQPSTPEMQAETPTCQVPSSTPTRPHAETALDNAGGIFYGPDAKWPDYVPEDIPVLDGEIELVVEVPGSFIRMRYTNITEEEIAQYLTALKREGFNLEGIVYVEPGFPDRSDEKLARGDYDAIEITRGEYSMRLEYGGGEASYLINTASFFSVPDHPTPTVVSAQWPDDIADLAPPPQNCPLTALLRLNPSGYHITCSQASDSVVADYVRALESLGFTEQNQLLNDQGKLVEFTLTKDGLALTLRPLFAGDLVIEIRPAVKWPDDVANLAPPPQHCLLSVLVELNPTGYRITCIEADKNVFAEYVKVLKSRGFVEQEQLQDDQGEIVKLTLSKGSESLTLSPMLTGELAIEIRPGVKWPDAVANLAPPPESCSLTYVTEVSPGVYHITCKQEAEGVVAAYAAALTAWGFTEQTRVQNDAGEISLLQLVNDDVTVNLWPAPPDHLSIDIRPNAP